MGDSCQAGLTARAERRPGQLTPRIAAKRSQGGNFINIKRLTDVSFAHRQQRRLDPLREGSSVAEG